MAQRPVSRIPKDPKDKPEKRQCYHCGDWKNDEDFYYSYSDLYKFFNRLPICKSCVLEIFEKFTLSYGDYKTAMYMVCKKFDVAFNHTVYDMAVKQSNTKSASLCGTYFQKINSMAKTNKYGTCFDESESLSNKDVQIGVEEYIDDFEITKDIVDFFGKGFSKADYAYLYKEYVDWTTRYECDSKSMETLIKQICYQTLEIDKKRSNGDKVDTQLKTLQDLLGASNLKPVQETGANSVDQNTFSTLIKKWENEKPIPEPDDEFKDVDGIKRYINIWFLGHLCKLLNIENSYSQMYEEEVNKYTVEITDDDVEESEL